MTAELVIPGHAAEEFDPNPDARIAYELNTLLRIIDDRLRCFWVRVNATSFEYPGRWHIGRFHTNPEFNTYWVICNEDGSYCEPQERHLQRLLQYDTHARNRYQDIEKARSTRKAEKRKQLEDTRRRFREELLDRLEHIANGRISVPKAVPVVVEQDKTLVDPHGNELRSVKGPVLTSGHVDRQAEPKPEAVA
jgi:hypothetical protein